MADCDPTTRGKLLSRVEATADALALVGLPALVITPDEYVLAANELADAMSPFLNRHPNGRIALADPAAQASLRRAFGDRAKSAAAAVSFPAKARSTDLVEETALSAVIHLIPMSARGDEAAASGLWVLCLTTVESPSAPDAALIAGLFDLTPNEARVAQSIVMGLTPAEIAQRFGVGLETVRSQVKAVLAKTGTRRQIEASSLINCVRKIPDGQKRRRAKPPPQIG